ncbi:MAG: nucleotidyltransferase family protein [Bacteroidia bacterium]|nr:nucleotidyltransferase family protein [Bacteroidia bacterium]
MNISGHTGPEHCSLVFLMAGRSHRFGRTKAFLRYNANLTFMQKLLGEYLVAGIKDMVLVINESISNETESLLRETPAAEHVKVLVNRNPDAGKLSSVQLGLNAVKQGHMVFLQNADNPFTGHPLLKQMMHAVRDGEYAIPVFRDRKGHPLLLSPAMIRKVMLENDMDTSLKSLLPPEAMVAVITEEEGVLANINTEADYHKYFPHAYCT